MTSHSFIPAQYPVIPAHRLREGRHFAGMTIVEILMRGPKARARRVCLYFLDNRVIDIASAPESSPRGETEIANVLRVDQTR